MKNDERRTAWIRIGGIMLAALLMLAGAKPFTAAGTLEVTYIANEGFLVSGGGKKILIDGLLSRRLIERYAHDNGQIHGQITQAQPPFDDIDLILITHVHPDHIEIESARRFLAASPKAVVVCPQQVAAKLEPGRTYRDRIQAVTPDPKSAQTVTAAGLSIGVLRLKHTPYLVTDRDTGMKRDRNADIENVGFAVQLGDRGVLHVGDSDMVDFSEYSPLGLTSRKTDVLFTPALYWGTSKERERIVKELIKPTHIVVMHLGPNAKSKYKTPQLEAMYPNAMIFQKPMERRSF